MKKKIKKKDIKKEKVFRFLNKKIIGIFFLLIVVLVCFDRAYFSYYNAKNEATHPHPTVSVLIPTYNRSDLLPRAIESILNQTVTDFELIIVDDGSVDNTAQILRKYIRQDDRIRVYFNHQNKGIGYSRNRLIDLSRAPYLAIMDSDDFSFPNRLQDEVDYLRKRPDVDWVSGLVSFLDHPSEIMTYYSQKEQHIPVELFFKCAVSHSASMVRKQYLAENNLKYNEHIIGNLDYDLFKRILLKKGKFGLVEKVVLAYRFHNKNSKEYYDFRMRSSADIQETLQRLMIPLPKNKSVHEIPYCRRLELMRESNQRLKWFEDSVFAQLINRDCMIIKNAIGYFYGANIDMGWEDYLLQTSQPFLLRRMENGEPFDIVKKTTDTIILKNKKGKQFTFQKRQNGYFMIEK